MAIKKSKAITVAKVNNKQLYETQLDTAVKEYNETLKNQGINIKSLGQDQLHNVRKFMLQKMVERELLHQEAIKKKIKVAAAEIEQIMGDMEKRYPSHQAFLDDILEDGDTKEWEKAKVKLRKIRSEKEDFRELAKKHSQCFSSKKGGDLGYYTRGQLYPPLEITAFKLKENEVSQPVESQEGVHLIKLYERRPQGFIPPFDEIKEQVEKVAKTEQAQNIYQEYIDELKQQANIEILEV